MKTGFTGTFVITWSQTETEGVKNAPLEALKPGALWRWTGDPVRVDGPQAVLRLDGADGLAELRRRAARVARRLVGRVAKAQVAPLDQDDPAPSTLGITVTDGLQAFDLSVLVVSDSGALLLAGLGVMPPADTDLWVVRTHIDPAQVISQGLVTQATPGGVICFVPGTRIATPQGFCLIEALQPGDLILTRDNDPQPVLWLGQRHVSGARLHALPALRPIRFRSGAFGRGRPDPDLLVSPQHRMLLKGRAAQALFNEAEVLVTAGCMVNDHTITTDRTLREVTYIHVLLGQHNIIWANGLETESFHPAHAALETVDPV